MTDLVSVIISSYNRYDLLVNAIKSIKNQTYKNIEIIIINDGSNDIRYLDLDNCIHLNEKNSRNILGYPSCGYVRNIGFQKAKGDFIAILDDDDYWLPNKIEKQLNILKNNDYLLCCTEAYLSKNNIDENYDVKNFKLYNGEYWKNDLQKILNIKTIPKIIDKTIIYKHNCIICSSVLFKKEVLKKIGFMKPVRNWKGNNGVFQDWDYWKRIILLSNIYYIQDPLLIYYFSNKKDYV